MNQSEEREELLLFVREHWLIVCRRFVLMLIIALLPLFVFDQLFSRHLLPMNSVFVTLIAMFVLFWMLCIWITYAIAWTERELSGWIISTYRVITIEYGRFFRRVLRAWSLDKVEEVDTEHGFFQGMFRYGDVVLQLAGAEDALVMKQIPHPEVIQTVILREQSRFAQLELANRQQEDVIQFVSHATKGYLTKNKAAFAAIVEGDYGQISTDLHAMAGAALKDTQHGVEAVMSILQEDSGAREFDFKALVSEEIESIRPAAHKKGLSVEYTEPEGDFTFTGNEPRVRSEVVRNLLDNAIRCTPSGSIFVELSKTTGVIRLCVKDTGVGITPEDMRVLFTKGGHGKDSLKINPESTGFGLAAGKVVVDALGGRIWAESEGEGKGSQFYVELPLS